VTEPEVVLSYADDRWRARGDGVDLAHADLPNLDALIARAFAERAPVCVHVRFDLAGLPTWLRQYQAHYCNYVLRVARQSEHA
jgi:Family of unknown function (DUF5395)